MIKIYEKFANLLPPLSKAEYEHLEQSILEEGIREPIRVWENKIVDGHNRFELAQNYDLPFETEEMIFPDEDSVCEWMMVNQLGRRNLEPNIKSLLIGQLYDLKKKKQGGDRKSEDFESEQKSKGQSDTLISTAEEVAEEFDVSPATVKRAGAIAKAFEDADKETQTAFKEGKVTKKALVEKTKPKEDKEIDSTRFNSHTNTFRLHGNRIMAAASKLQEEIGAYENYLFASKIDGKPLAKAIHREETANAIELVRIFASSLKRIVICPVCSSDGCDKCQKTGYMVAEDAEAHK